MKITLATTSFTPVYSKEANLQQYFKYIDKAAEKNARLIVQNSRSRLRPGVFRKLRKRTGYISWKMPS